MRKLISICLLVVVTIMLLIPCGISGETDSPDYEDQKDCCDGNYERLLSFCIDELDKIQLYSDIRDFVAYTTDLEELLKDPTTLGILNSIKEEENRQINARYVDAIIKYIDSGFTITDICDLLYMTYTPITLQTLSGKTIAAKRYTGNETPYGFPNLDSFVTYGIVNGPSYAYNCHSFAWYYGGNYNASDKIIIDNPLAYRNPGDTCYSIVCASVTLATLKNRISTGQITLQPTRDIIVYEANSNESAGVSMKHSALVYDVSGTTIKVVSKWGEKEVIRHRIDSCPYFKAPDGAERKLTIYRRNHTINSSINANRNYFYYDSSRHSQTCVHCARGIPSNSSGVPNTLRNHTFSTVGAVIVCTGCGNRPYAQQLLLEP